MKLINYTVLKYLTLLQRMGMLLTLNSEIVYCDTKVKYGLCIEK